MVSEVIISELAMNMLDDYIAYLLFEKKSEQAAKNLIMDARESKDKQLNVAESLRYCNDEDLKRLGYRPIFFIKHNYLYIYRVDDNKVYIEAIYHQLQDYENLFKRDNI